MRNKINIFYKPASFHASIDEITERSFMQRLLIGIKNSGLPDEKKEREILRLSQTVWEFWRNEDHGLAHSIKVYERCVQIVKSCPNMIRKFCKRHVVKTSPAIDYRFDFTNRDIDGFLTWSSLLHDFFRFMPPLDTLKEHQRAGAIFAENCFKDSAPFKCSEIFYEMLKHHDYICEIVDKEKLPKVFMDNPLAEIFRLADTTSLSPVDEICRWYATGKRLNSAKFFDPELPLESRLDFSIPYNNWDFLNHFLLFFAIQPSDWFYAETSKQYRKWQEETEGGKSRALAKIFDMAREEKCSIDDIYRIREIFKTFFAVYCLPNYLS